MKSNIVGITVTTVILGGTAVGKSDLTESKMGKHPPGRNVQITGTGIRDAELIECFVLYIPLPPPSLPSQ